MIEVYSLPVPQARALPRRWEMAHVLLGVVFVSRSCAILIRTQQFLGCCVCPFNRSLRVANGFPNSIPPAGMSFFVCCGSPWRRACRLGGSEAAGYILFASHGQDACGSPPGAVTRDRLRSEGPVSQTFLSFGSCRPGDTPPALCPCSLGSPVFGDGQSCNTALGSNLVLEIGIKIMTYQLAIRFCHASA